MEYYIVPQQIVDVYQDYIKQDYGIHFRQDVKNRWVINVGCGEEIFDEIEWITFPIETLTDKDFPTTVLPI